MEERGTVSPEALALVSAVIRDVVRAKRLPATDAQDFAQTVHLKFIEREYDVFTRFRGDSSLRTYLTVVVMRALLDWRNARYGKWRPSAAAVRLGPEAVMLDQLINRDSFAEEIAIAQVRGRSGSSPERLRRLAAQVPRRTRVRFVPDDCLQMMPAAPDASSIDADERRQRLTRVRRALRNAYRQLPDEERRLLSMRYGSRLSVREISETLQMDQKALYRRFERVVCRLRASMAAQIPSDLSASV